MSTRTGSWRGLGAAVRASAFDVVLFQNVLFVYNSLICRISIWLYGMQSKTGEDVGHLWRWYRVQERLRERDLYHHCNSPWIPSLWSTTEGASSLKQIRCVWEEQDQVECPICSPTIVPLLLFFWQLGFYCCLTEVCFFSCNALPLSPSLPPFPLLHIDFSPLSLFPFWKATSLQEEAIRKAVTRENGSAVTVPFC